ncbi:MAG: bifunctional lysine ketoglutarate reductase /saccharopine dehydrogenase family protein [Thermoanaerobaculales bacterium]
MSDTIGIRSETKSPWERRSPVTPELTRKVVGNSGIEVLVQPSARRVFPDNEYVRAGGRVVQDLSEASVILGVKEIPPDQFLPGMAYLFFSHVIKGQPYNMPMLARMMELGCTLIDYEKVCDESGRRLIFFGRFAGLAGMIDALWALGQRLQTEGIRTPFASIQPAHSYSSLEEAKAAVRAAGELIASNGLPASLTPLVIGVAGYGNVAGGVREILAELPTRGTAPTDLSALAENPSPRRLFQTTFREEHLVEPQSPEHIFELQDYYRHPEKYRSTFDRFLPHLTVLMNCNYWDEKYPRLVTKKSLGGLFTEDSQPRLRVIGDLGCDVEGAVECTLKCTDPSDPVYVYDVQTDTISSGVEGHGPVVLAVDILPAELPREASEEFSQTLAHFLPALAKADFSAPFERLALPDELKSAVIVHRGELTPDYAYLEQHLARG